ncbi:MAG: ATP-dependent DNA helicase RecG [Thermoanaerobaculia bacterium]
MARPSPKTEWQPDPDKPVQYLRGVGQSRAALFETAGIRTARDLVYLFPRRYEDRRNQVTVAELGTVDSPVAIRGRILSCGTKLSPIKRLEIFEAILDDGSGTITLVWFNQPYRAKQIARHTQLAVFGQPRVNNRGRLQIENPDVEVLPPDGESDYDGAVVPIYPAISMIPGKSVRGIVRQALETVGAIEDPLPASLRKELGVIGLHRALVQMHQPDDLTPTFLAGESAAHRRLILEEFFRFQLALRIRRAAEERQTKERTVRIDDAVRERVRKVLPFRLTGAQKRVLKEIAADMTSDRPMYRLLQGDVGSGKTIVALIAAILAIENGHQAALLAPTEILAEQHYQRISQLLESSGIRVAKLSGATPAAARRDLLGRLAAGRIDILVGTHAILEPAVRFHSLGLAIVDEQHRFGVVQRQKLFLKGNLPDILVMTATPIPRSLAIALYGDLELSVIDELPPGRLPVRTVVRGSARFSKVLEFVAKEVASGAQAYVVYPIIDESEVLDLKPLTAGYEEIREALPNCRVAMLHGRMSAEEKEAVMERFKEREVDILVSTTVIEVGIDVPAASTMVVVGADRFGFSQLHQLRGRIGRGSRRSYCVLIRDEKASEEAKQRLRSFESTRDGFEVAERDLAARGAGDFFGTRQSGVPRFRYGDLLRHHRLMEKARDVAISIIRREGLAGAERLVKTLMPEWSLIEKD